MEEEIIEQDATNNTPLESDEKKEKLKGELLSRVLSGNLITMHDRVGYILNNYEDARNSDIELAWNYWLTFENTLFNGEHITKEQLKNLTKERSLIRARAQIQNEYKLFEANDQVKKYRGVLKEEKTKEVVDNKPAGLPFYSVYIDESGKTQKFLSIGSLWVVDNRSTLSTGTILNEWIKTAKIEHEFHFTELSQQRLNTYKEFFLRFLQLNPTMAFKAIIINKEGVSDLNKALTDLTFHLINKGIIQENVNNRAPLPRTLQVWLDEEEKGSDRLKIENLRERLTSQRIEGLYLGEFFAIPSNINFYMQAVDLFVAALNRKIHNPISAGKVKDELADYILQLIGFNISSLNFDNSDIDKSFVFDLRYVDGTQ